MKKILNFISKTSSGLATGLFATLIIGTILKQIFTLINFQIGIDIAITLMNLMGIGIALGVCLSIDKELNPLELVSIMSVGAISSSINLLAYNNPIPTFIGSKNPLLIYLVIIFLVLIYKKLNINKTPIDILLKPLIIISIGTVLSFILIYPCYYLIYGIQKIIEVSIPLLPILMAIIISIVVGMTLTMPISSVAICIAISIGDFPLASGAAVIGCTCQMIGFATQAIKAKNGIGKGISIGIGTSMLYWPNIIKKPVVWLPTILSSAILGPLLITLFNIKSTSSGAGMGSSGLVGQFSILEAMGYNNPLAYISIFALIISSIILTLLFEYLFNNILHLYNDDDLKLN